MSETPKMSFFASMQAKKDQANESKAAAPKAESNSSAPSVQKESVATPRTPVAKPNSLFGALRTQSAGDDASKAGKDGVVESGESKSGGEAVSTRESLPDGNSKSSVPATTSFASRLAAAQKAVADAPEKPNYDHLFDSIPENFQEVLDKFDALLIRDNGVTEINVVHLRDYVKRIFVDLRDNPEYDGLIIDRDVKNIIGFMRAVKGQAQELAVEKKEKKAKSDSKKVGKNKFAAIAGSLDFNGGVGIPQKLEDLEDFNGMEDLP